ncbi:hypothetical protein DFQ26_001740 [Actinomortierella ambigua]|nr:hypothetical protein DFQ26_001740 [Actinomortierella ambigua]
MVPEINAEGIPKADHVTVFFASQTGNAESISRNIHEQAQERGFKSQHFVLNDFAKVDWATEDCMVFVVSTTGDGDPPDNSTKFWRHLRKLKGTGLTKAKYALLGLGDTNYDNFCNTAKRLDGKLQDLGASSFYARGLADDATGLEEVVDPWIKNLWPALAHQVICSPQPHDLPITKEELKIFEKLAHAHDKPAAPAPAPTPTTAPAAASTPAPVSPKAVPAATTTTTTTTTSTIKETATTTSEVSKALEGLSIAGEDKKETPASSSVSASASASAIEPATGYTIEVDFSTMAQHSNLTALPRVPNANLKITHVSDEEKIAPAPAGSTTTTTTTSVLPRFVQAPTKLLPARISRVECLTTGEALKRTLGVEFSFEDDVEYAPGDAFGIWAPNDEAMVRGVLTALEVPEAEWDKAIQLEGTGIPSHLQAVGSSAPGKVTLLDIFRYSVDLTTAPKKANIRMYGDYATDMQEKQRLMFMASKQGGEVFNAFRAQGPTLLDILKTFPSIRKTPLARLIETLPPHQPRYYSITNSPMARHGHRRMTCAFNVVTYELPEGKKRQGICTPWLDRLSGLVGVGQVLEGSAIPSHVGQVQLFLRPAETKFNLPQDTTKPVIMIGPGTGVAPFMGFLEHRAEQRRMKKRLMTIWTGAKRQQHLEEVFGEMWLFFGCRHRDKDWLFRRQMLEYQEEGVLSELFIAVSREEDLSDVAEDRSGKYVQDVIKKQAEKLWHLMSKKGAVIYVCGDAKGMAKGVHDELVNILVEYGGMDKMAAMMELNKWAQEKRYLRDLWA